MKLDLAVSLSLSGSSSYLVWVADPYYTRVLKKMIFYGRDRIVLICLFA